MAKKSKSPVAYARGSVWGELQSRDRQGAGAFAYLFTASHSRGSVTSSEYGEWPGGRGRKGL
jgi:hypothetical protein